MRRFLIAALALLVAVLLGAAALMDYVSFGLVDRPLLGALIVFAVTLWSAGRSAYRVRRHGAEAAAPAPPEPGEAAPRDPALEPVDRFLVAERFKLIGDRYELSSAAPDGEEPDRLLATIERAAFQARERLEARGADGAVLFTVQAQRILDVGGRYLVHDAEGGRIGELRKLFVDSLIRSSWEVWDGGGTLVARARERSLALALGRRVTDILPLPIPYHFDLHGAGGEALGSVTRRRTIRDRYVLDLSGDDAQLIDRRLALALGVALDALQDR